jgi:glycosyltransferase involved in cell wall biosynthesis
MDTPAPVMLMLYSLFDGGTERQVTELAKWLDRSEFEVHVAAFHFGQPLLGELQTAGVPTLRLPMTSFLSGSFAKSLLIFRDYLRRHSIRFVHTFDPTSTIFVSAAGRLMRIPCFLSSQRAYRSLTFPRYRPLLRISDRLVDGIIVNCEAMRRHLIEDEHAPPSRIHVCYNAIDTERFHPVQPRQDEAGPVIGTACVFREEKDLGCLLKASAAIRTDYPQASLRMIGDGSERPELERLSEELGLDGRCRFLPFQANVENYLPEIDIFVLPSLSEALSNSLMEAMACGCCTVATNVGGTPEMIRSGETGLLFDPGDDAGLALQLRRLIEDRQLRCRLAEAGCRYVRENFSRKQMVKRMETIYRDYFERI